MRTYYNLPQINLMKDHSLPIGDVDFFTFVCQIMDDDETDWLKNEDVQVQSLHALGTRRTMALTRIKRLISIGLFCDQQVQKVVRLTKEGQRIKDLIDNDRGDKYTVINAQYIAYFCHLKHRDRVISVKMGRSVKMSGGDLYVHFVESKLYEEVKSKTNCSKL